MTDATEKKPSPRWAVTAAFLLRNRWTPKVSVVVDASQPHVALARGVQQAKQRAVARGVRVYEISAHVSRVAGATVQA